jgi:hypothetical protein
MIQCMKAGGVGTGTGMADGSFATIEAGAGVLEGMG